MFNPYEPFTFGLIDAFRQKKHQWLVTQSFNCDEAKKLERQGVLLTPYADPGLAKGHRNALRTDALACIMDLEVEAHRKKLEEMIAPLSKYNLWVGLVRDRVQVEQRLERRYSLNIRRYIQNHTTWRIKGDSTFNVIMKIIFGEVYVLMRYSNREEIQVRLEEIAKN